MSKRRGFTLVELLVVVAILAVLVAILMPALGRARDLARKAVCGARMKQFGSAIGTYMGTYHSYPHFAQRSDYLGAQGFWIYGGSAFVTQKSFAWPKFYAVLEQLGFQGTDRTTWGVHAYLWEADEIWDGALCPAMDSVAILRWADQALLEYRSPEWKVGMHKAACGYAWNFTLRARIPRYHAPDVSQWMEGRWPPQLQPMSDAAGPNDNTKWIWWVVRLPDGNGYGTQAINIDEVDDTSQVAEAWDSNDLDTTPNVWRTGAYSVENLLPGCHWGPQTEHANGWAMLNGGRHPGSPNILYADGSVRADATKPLAISDLGSCPSGTWRAMKVNSWAERSATLDGTDIGTLHHIIPQRKVWRK